MKKIIIAALLLISGAVQAQQATDVTVRQRNAFNTGWLDRFLSPPPGGVDGVLYIDGAAIMPGVLTLGTGLSITGGVLNAAVGGAPAWADITGKPSFAPVATTGAYGDLTGKPLLFSGAYSDLSGIPATFAPAAHMQAWATITSTPTTLAGYGITDAATSAALGSGLATKFNAPAGSIAQYLRGDGSLATFPAIPAAQVNSDWSSVSGVSQILNKPTIPAAQVQSDWNAVSGLGVILNKPSIPSVTAFNFGSPVVRTLAVATQYQAADPSKAAITTISPSCVNATTLLASSACTIQVRQASATGLTCSTGTVSMTWSSTVQLGLVFNQTSGSPFDIKIPTGGYFILCATAGTFTISAVEQSAG